ncbi:MAG: Rid family detoxifying hydrolase, partial [Candidatus Eisenbacteria bacterium]|nr:Rid family detoxifying hydrolase [Candidatus Eisenbacteria bacterium]
MRKMIQTDEAPKAIGPYSQAIEYSVSGPIRMIYSSGQVAIDPAIGKLIQGDVAVQTTRVFQNLVAVLAARGFHLTDVVKATVYLTDMAHFAAMNEVYATHFPAHPPARSTVAVSGLPAGALV